jgi:hypothetical protein
MDVIEEEKPETVTAQLPADTPAPPIGTTDDRSLDDLLNQFDLATKQPESEPQQLPGSENGAVSNEELDRLLAEVGGPSADAQRANQLQGELDGLKAEINRQQELAAFEKFADSLQGRLPSHIPPGFAKDALMSMAHDDTKQMAWLYRNVDRQQVDAELRRVEAAFDAIRRNPVGVDPNKVAQLRDYGMRLGIAYNAQQILRNAERDIIKRAEAHKVYDPEQTQIHDDVAWAVRSAHGKAPEEPPPRLGSMTDAEFRDYTRKNFGF